MTWGRVTVSAPAARRDSRSAGLAGPTRAAARGVLIGTENGIENGTEQPYRLVHLSGPVRPRPTWVWGFEPGGRLPAPHVQAQEWVAGSLPPGFVIGEGLGGGGPMRALRGEPTKPVLELKTSKSKSTAKSKSTERERRDRGSDATTSLINANETTPSRRLERVSVGGEKRRVTRANRARYMTSPASLGSAAVTPRRPSRW
jgi:hypothetical protein